MPHHAEIDALWPPFALRISYGPVTLSPVRDEDLPGLVSVVRSGVHKASEMPFASPWTSAEPEQIAGQFARFQWSQRAAMSPESWTLALTARRDGEIVGSQSISTSDYLTTRTGETGSWLGMRHQGRGTGTLMRQAICAFMFDEMDAEEVTSAAFTDNPASLAVSRKVGYRENGVVRTARREGELAFNSKLRVTAPTLNRAEHALEVEGVPDLRKFLGLV